MKKLLSMLLCAAMLFCMLPLEARAASDAWDGTVDLSWYDPAKTEYEIDTPAKLAGLAALVNGMADPTAKKIVGKRNRTLVESDRLRSFSVEFILYFDSVRHNST